MSKRKRAPVDDTIEEDPLQEKKNRKEISYATQVAGVSNGSPDDSSLLVSQINKLSHAFFAVPCIQLAKDLLGKVLVRVLKDGNDESKQIQLHARIVETEAYLGGEDKASHSYNGKQTPRNKAMFMSPGTAYVYSIHTYVCFNISCGNGAAVLIRACQPLEGVEHMTQYRIKRNDNGKRLKAKEICNGPSKLCIALNITKEDFNQVDLVSCERFYVADDGHVVEDRIVECPRIGIGNYAEEWTEKPLRFYLESSDCVSTRFKSK